MTPRSRLLRLIVLIAGTIALFRIASAADDAAPSGLISIEELLRIWKEREEQVKTLRAEFKVLRTVAKGSQLSQAPLTPGEQKFYPEEDSVFECKGMIWIDGEKWRTDVIGPYWHPPTGKFLQTDLVAVFDGSRYLSFHGKEAKGDRAFPFATYWPREEQGIARYGWMPVSMPWLVGYRNSHPVFLGVRPEDWSIGHQHEVIDGQECFAISANEKLTHGGHEHCWIAPALGYRIVRRELGPRPDSDWGSKARLDVKYRGHPDYGFVPDAWEWSLHNKSNLGNWLFEQSQACSVEILQINEPFPEEDPFDYALPVGTRVNDFSARQETARYISKDGGEKRLILQQEIERGATYTQMLSSNAGQAGRPIRDGDTTWPLWACVSILSVAVGGYFLQRRR